MKNIITAICFYLKKLIIIAFVGCGIFQICYKQSIAWDIMRSIANVISDSDNQFALFGASLFACGIAYLARYFCWLTLRNIDTEKHHRVNVFMLMAICGAMVLLTINQVFDINSFVWCLFREGIFNIAHDNNGVFIITILLFFIAIILIPLQLLEMLIKGCIDPVKKYVGKRRQQKDTPYFT